MTKLSEEKLIFFEPWAVFIVYLNPSLILDKIFHMDSAHYIATRYSIDYIATIIIIQLNRFLADILLKRCAFLFDVEQSSTDAWC